jgi:hypothetical protein
VDPADDGVGAVAGGCDAAVGRGLGAVGEGCADAVGCALAEDAGVDRGDGLGARAERKPDAETMATTIGNRINVTTAAISHPCFPAVRLEPRTACAGGYIG